MLVVAKHELTHYMKEVSKDGYYLYRDFLVQQMMEKRGVKFETLVDRYAAAYRGISRDDILDEIAADAAELFFTDRYAIKKFANKNKNLGKKILSFVSSLANGTNVTKQYTYMGKELSEYTEVIRKAERLWVEALSSDTATTSNKQTFGKEKYSISYTTDNKPVVIVEDNILAGVPEDEWIDTVKRTIKNRFLGGIPISGRLIKINLKTNNEYTKSKYSQRLEKKDKIVYEDKFKAAGHLDEIILASTNYINEDLNHARKDNFVQFARGDVLFRIGKNDYAAKVIVGFTTGRNMVLYDVIDFKQKAFMLKNKKADGKFAAQLSDNSKNSSNPSTNNIINRNGLSVNSNYMQDGENDSEQVKYSLSQSFAEQVDDVINNRHNPNNHIYMGNTPQRLVNILGLKKLPMLITPRHVFTMTMSEEQAKKDSRYNAKDNYHGLGKETMAKLPKAIDKPVFIIKSDADTNDTRFVVATDLFDKKGDRIIVAVQPGAQGKYFDVRLITNIALSGYGKKNFISYLETAKKEDRILYAFNKYNQQNQNGPGVQFPDSILSADYSDNLTRFRRIVNSNYMQENKNNSRGVIPSIDDNSQNEYNKKGGTSYERTDEFRRIQEESRNLSEREQQLFHSGDREIDENLRRRLSRTFKDVLISESGVSGNGYGLLTLRNGFSVYENVDANVFHDIFEINRNYLRNGELVDLHNIETTEDGIGYNDCTNYLSDDGMSGFSITPKGDLISVFNLGSKRGFLRAITPIVSQRARTLDCYNSDKQPLMQMYESKFGFQTASLMDYNMEYDHDNIAANHSKPQVAFMVNTDAEVTTKHFTEDEYEAAVAYRDSYNTSSDSRYQIRNEDFDSLVEKYGYIVPGVNPAREVKVPKRTKDDDTVADVRITDTSDEWYSEINTTSGRFLTLSTCYGSSKNGRLLVLAVSR